MNAISNPNDLRARPAKLEDATAIALIYNQGIEDRVATFETKMRGAADVTAWFDGVHPLVVVEADGRIVAFVSTSTYRPRDCYAGIAEVSLYVERGFRGQGAGRLAMQAIIHEAEKAGFWKFCRASFWITSLAANSSLPQASARSASTRTTVSWMEFGAMC